MKEEIKNFVEAYLDKIENDNLNKSRDLEYPRMSRSISFHIHRHISIVDGFISDRWSNHILKLDDEDIEYLFKKFQIPIILGFGFF